jgi:excisionase family DNA binding protein
MSSLPESTSIRTLIAIDAELVASLQATLEETRLELIKLQLMNRPEEPMTLKEAAAYLKISRQTLSVYASNGAITPSEYGNRVWYTRRELDAFLHRHRRKYKH